MDCTNRAIHFICILNIGVLLLVDLGTLGHQVVSDRRSDENRSYRTYDDADRQGEDEAADGLAAEEEDVLIVRDSVELMALFTFSLRLRLG